MKPILQSKKLDHVHYDIRGRVMVEAQRLERAGEHVTKLNIGNPATFGFNAPDSIVQEVERNLRAAQGYVDSKGILPAREAIARYYRSKGIDGADAENIYIGNGVSELITMTMQGLLNGGDEVLIPSPDYPLWTAATYLSGGTPVHYICDERSDWNPDLDDIRSKVTSRTKAIVVINPNNPTGAVYTRDTLEAIHELAAEKGLLVLADEIYEKIVFDGVERTLMSSLCSDIPCITFNGISKAYLATGFRAGWMMLSGALDMLSDFRKGLNTLSNMRLCSNVPSQFAIQPALEGYQDIEDLVLPKGRLYEQRNVVWEMANAIPGMSAVKPRGALYIFPRIDAAKFNITDDEKFVYDLLVEKRVLLVQGRGFNWKEPNHFRIVFLPEVEDLRRAMTDLGDFLSGYRQTS